MGRLQARGRGARKSIESLRGSSRLEKETFGDKEENTEVRAQVPDGTAHVAGPTGLREATISYSKVICRSWQQRPLKYTNKKIHVRQTRLLRPETTRVAGDARVAK